MPGLLVTSVSGGIVIGVPFWHVVCRFSGEILMIGIFVMSVLLIALVGCLPSWWHARRWGYGPSATAGVLLVIAVTMVFTGNL